MFGSITGRQPATPGVFDHDHKLWTLNARSALMIGLHSMRLQRGDEILVPAYHCPVLIYPIVEQGLKPVYYRIKDDCSIDIDDLHSRITLRTRAIVAIHYFGYPTDLCEVKTLCDKHDCYLVEDCAHAFFGHWPDQPIGSKGDISIGSLYKFFSTVDGGGIIFNNDQLWHAKDQQSHAPLFAQLKSFLNTLETRQDSNRSSGLTHTLLRLKEALWKRLKPSASAGQANDDMNSLGDEQADADSPFTARQIASSYSSNKMPLFSYLIYRFTSREKLIKRRREHYQHLHSELSKLGYTPLFKTLPDGVVPYNLPIVTEKANEIAETLRANGVSVARFGEFYWDERDRSTCPTSNQYSKHCIQLPIHQSLTHQDLHHIVDTLRAK